MAEFVQTMKDWKRMCIAADNGPDTSKCGNCPMGVCRLCCFEISDIQDEELEEAEATITAWAKEHPEPDTPTWFDYLCDIGMFLDCKTAPEVLAALTELHIPPAIAERLGLLPE